MHSRTSPTAVLALLLTVVFLGAQFHFCADLDSAQASTHFCPVCSATTSAMASESLLPVEAAVSDRLEIPGVRLILPSEIPQATSPRAPPASRSVR